MSHTTRTTRLLPLAAALLIAAAGHLSAQDRGVSIYGYGGGYSSLVDLDAADTQDFKTGFNVGGGISVDLHRYVAIRGDFTFSRSELRNGGVDTDNKFNKLFYGGDLVLRYPFAGGFTPYVFGGGGAVTLDDDADTNPAPSSTRGAGRFGIGFSYQFWGSPIGIFAQGTGWVYSYDEVQFPQFTETQFDAVYSAGLSYRFGF